MSTQEFEILAEPGDAVLVKHFSRWEEAKITSVDVAGFQVRDNDEELRTEWLITYNYQLERKSKSGKTISGTVWADRLATYGE